MVKLFGGFENIIETQIVANTRVIVKVAKEQAVQFNDLKTEGQKLNLMVEKYPNGIFHIIAGKNIKELKTII